MGKWKGGLGKERTFAILARRKERMRNLNLSSSVCVIMRLKFAEGSIVPVMSSTVSIYFFGRVSCQLFFLLLVFVPRVLCSWLDGSLWYSPSQPAFLLLFSLLPILLRETLTSFYRLQTPLPYISITFTKFISTNSPAISPSPSPSRSILPGKVITQAHIFPPPKPASKLVDLLSVGVDGQKSSPRLECRRYP